MATNESLNDELTSINSIYGDGTLTPTSPSSPIYNLTLPSLPSITLRIEFPHDYPNAPPSILGTQSVGEDIAKGVGNQIVDVVRDVLAQVYQPGEECIFTLLEEVRDAIEKAEEQGSLHLHDQHHEDPNLIQQQPTQQNPSSTLQDDILDLGPPPPWTIAPSITEKKSIFLARSARVTSPTQAKSYLHHFLSTDKKAARATHNITAWRIRGPDGTSYQDCDDDGETAAGGRMLHLLQLMDVWDVMVVVTRWYGGVLLGPDRFRIINSAARDAVVLGGFGGEGGAGEKGKKGKK
ncbi:ribosomal protein S5 domain 2-type protein [Dendryphion nanum]|uniref:Ribosomal protein S5 domain 2-type protein n=1 Tax=Dendryphion nanum TaxID=256645 RepID=A0A9P9ED82_9PLEO|nr:ribosomal protein S5 domain 2-type protein [Dendryphion nanum]